MEGNKKTSGNAQSASRINKTFCGNPPIGLRIHKVTCRFTQHFVAIHKIVRIIFFGVIHRFSCQSSKCYVNRQKFLWIHESFRVSPQNCVNPQKFLSLSTKFCVNPQKFLSLSTILYVDPQKFSWIHKSFRQSTKFHVGPQKFLCLSTKFLWIDTSFFFSRLNFVWIHQSFCVSPHHFRLEDILTIFVDNLTNFVDIHTFLRKYILFSWISTQKMCVFFFELGCG